MAYFGDSLVRTGRVMLIWDGINNPDSDNKTGAVKHNVRVAMKQNAPEVQELTQIATKALNESEFRGQLPPGGNWPLTTMCDTEKLTNAVANCLSIGASTQQGVPPIYDDQGNELAAMQYKQMLYPGAIVELLVHAFAYNNINKGIAFGLDGIQIHDATRPRLPVGSGVPRSQVQAAFTGGNAPAAGSPESYPPIANTSTMPDIVMTAKAGNLTLEQYQAAGWTVDQLIQHGYAERKAAPAGDGQAAAPAAPPAAPGGAPTAPATDFSSGPGSVDDDVPF